ncbi:hypothetical protein GEMRC1_012020 [Eukaryota sp. GEM-RC1]
MRRTAVYNDLNANRPSKALKTLTLLVNRSPNNVEYHLLRALCYIRLYQYHDAHNSIDTALSLPFNPNLISLYEPALKSLGRNSDLLDVYSVLVPNSDDEHFAVTKAKILLRDQQFLNASKSFLTLYKSTHSSNYLLSAVCCNLLEGITKPKLFSLGLGLLQKVTPTDDSALQVAKLAVLFSKMMQGKCFSQAKRIVFSCETYLPEVDFLSLFVELHMNSLFENSDESVMSTLKQNLQSVIIISFNDVIPNFKWFQFILSFNFSEMSDFVSELVSELQTKRRSIHHERTLDLFLLLWKSKESASVDDSFLNRIIEYFEYFSDKLPMMVEDVVLILKGADYSQDDFNYLKSKFDDKFKIIQNSSEPLRVSIDNWNAIQLLFGNQILNSTANIVHAAWAVKPFKGLCIMNDYFTHILRSKTANRDCEKFTGLDLIHLTFFLLQ